MQEAPTSDREAREPYKNPYGRHGGPCGLERSSPSPSQGSQEEGSLDAKQDESREETMKFNKKFEVLEPSLKYLCEYLP